MISGLSGFGAINFNFELIKISKNLLIANKETIICGGKVFIDYAKKNNCKIVPIDSEHHCLDFFLKTNLIKKHIDKFFITASGGPFFDKKINFNESIKNVINHPTWKMGKKISVDSSTFANKVLELFEAKILFNLDPHSLEVIVDTKSLSHNVIKFKNNIFFAIIHEPNMEIPISNSLNVKNKNKLKIEGLDISLKKANLKKFPTLDIGYRILKSNSPSLMIFFTVINETLVHLYLKKKIKYGEIVRILRKTFNLKFMKKYNIRIRNLNDIQSAIEIAKKIKLL